MTVEDELLQLRAENRRQQEQIRVQQEQLAKQEELIAQLQERIHALEERLSKNSRNSHLPPSSDRFVRQPKSLRHKSGKKPGGQEGHAGSTLMFASCPDEVIVHAVACCQHCQQDLAHIAPAALERRQVFDLPEPSPRLRVQEHQAEHKQCPACQQITVACFPPEVRAPVQYGPAIGAIGVYLVQQQLLPLARACEVMEDLLGVWMSEGTLCELIARCAQSLTEVEQQVKAALMQAQVLHHDETGLYVTGKRQWVHVTCTATLTHYQVHASRGHKALEAIGILPLFHGISVHDGWRAYWRYGCEHGACNVHVVRELTFLADEEHLPWAADLKAVLLDMKAAADAAREQGKTRVHPLEVIDWEAGFLELLDEGEAAHPLAHAPPATAFTSRFFGDEPKDGQIRMQERRCRQFGRIRMAVSSLKRCISVFFVWSSKKPTSESPATADAPSRVRHAICSRDCAPTSKPFWLSWKTCVCLLTTIRPSAI